MTYISDDGRHLFDAKAGEIALHLSCDNEDGGTVIFSFTPQEALSLAYEITKIALDVQRQNDALVAERNAKLDCRVHLKSFGELLDRKGIKL